MSVPWMVPRTLAALLFPPAAASSQELPLRTGTQLGCQFNSAAIRDTIDFTRQQVHQRVVFRQQ